MKFSQTGQGAGVPGFLSPVSPRGVSFSFELDSIGNPFNITQRTGEQEGAPQGESPQTEIATGNTPDHALSSVSGIEETAVEKKAYFSPFIRTQSGSDFPTENTDRQSKSAKPKGEISSDQSVDVHLANKRKSVDLKTAHHDPVSSRERRMEIPSDHIKEVNSDPLIQELNLGSEDFSPKDKQGEFLLRKEIMVDETENLFSESRSPQSNVSRGTDEISPQSTQLHTLPHKENDSLLSREIQKGNSPISEVGVNAERLSEGESSGLSDFSPRITFADIKLGEIDQETQPESAGIEVKSSLERGEEGISRPPEPEPVRDKLRNPSLGETTVINDSIPVLPVENAFNRLKSGAPKLIINRLEVRVVNQPPPVLPKPAPRAQPKSSLSDTTESLDRLYIGRSFLSF